MPMIRSLALTVLAAAALQAAHAQPFSTIAALGPLTIESAGETVALRPLAAAAAGDGFVVLAMGETGASALQRRQPWALRLDADGALVQKQSLYAAVGRVDYVLDPLIAPTMRPDGDGWLAGGIFETVDLETDGTRDVLRAVRIAPDLSATVVAERALGPADTVLPSDVIRLGDDLVLFTGRVLVYGGNQTIPLALVVSAEGGEKSLVPPATWSEGVTAATVAGSHLVLAGWTEEVRARELILRVFDASLEPVGARRITTHGFARGASIATLDGDRVLLASALPDSLGTEFNRILVGVASVPGGDVLGSAFAGERSAWTYDVEDIVSVAGLGTAVLARAPLGDGRSRAAIVRHPENGAPGWTAFVGSPAKTGHALAVGASGGTPTALSAVEDSSGAWHLELARLNAARPVSALYAPFEDAVVADEAAFDAYARVLLATSDPAERGAALFAYGAALDVGADSASVSHELQRQATALLDDDFARGADAINAVSVRLLMRVRPGLPVERQRCLGSLFLWTMARERALGSARPEPVPPRPATDCD